MQNFDLIIRQGKNQFDHFSFGIRNTCNDGRGRIAGSTVTVYQSINRDAEVVSEFPY